MCLMMNRYGGDNDWELRSDRVGMRGEVYVTGLVSVNAGGSVHYLQGRCFVWKFGDLVRRAGDYSMMDGDVGDGNNECRKG